MNSVYRFYQTNVDNPIKHGAWLVVTDDLKRDAILDGRALNETAPYGPSNTLRVTGKTASALSIECLVSNIGETDSDMCRLVFVIWGEDGRTGVFKYPVPMKVPARQEPNSVSSATADVEIVLAEIEVPASAPKFTDTKQISHIYCIAYDVLRDPLDKARTDLYRAAKAGTKLNGVNPLRTSTAIGGCKIQDTFAVNGNTITVAQETFVEMVLTHVDAGADSGFGQRLPDGSIERWQGSLKNTPRHVLLPEKKLLQPGDGVFVLLSTIGTRLSNNPNYCRLTPANSNQTLKLEFEDGGGGSYDDYHLHVYEF